MPWAYLPTGQPIPGPQQGIGRLEVADWWLAMAVMVLGATEAAAAPATTTDRAKI